MADSPQGWWEEFRQWFSGAGLAFGVGIFYGLRWAFKDWWSNRSDSAKEEKRQRERDRRSEDRQDKDLTTAWARIDDLEDGRREIERDRDRGWDLARGWFDVAHQERHARNNLLMAAGGRALDPLPGFEELEGRRQ